MTDVEVGIAQSSRHGAPMTLSRASEERDLAAIAAMGEIRAAPFRFHLNREVDFVRYAITKKRLLAGPGSSGSRQLHFFMPKKASPWRSRSVGRARRRDPAGLDRTRTH